MIYESGGERHERSFKELDDALAFAAVAEALGRIVPEELDTGIRVIRDPELHELLRPIQETHARIQSRQSLLRIRGLRN